MGFQAQRVNWGTKLLLFGEFSGVDGSLRQFLETTFGFSSSSALKKYSSHEGLIRPIGGTMTHLDFKGLNH